MMHSAALLLPLLPSLGGGRVAGILQKETLFGVLAEPTLPHNFFCFFPQILLSSHLLPNTDEKTTL